MEISERLERYLERQFQEMLSDTDKCGRDIEQVKFILVSKDGDRCIEIVEKVKRTPASTRRKQRQQTRDKNLRILKARKDITSEDYIKAHAAILAEYERDPKQRGTSKQKRYKTKATTDLNVFLYRCFYLIRKENPEAKDAKLYDWIEGYLKDKDYRMKNKKFFYDPDAIKKRIRYYKNENPAIISAINSLIDDDYARLT